MCHVHYVVAYKYVYKNLFEVKQIEWKTQNKKETHKLKKNWNKKIKKEEAEAATCGTL
jgi:hypothetical protein